MTAEQWSLLLCILSLIISIIGLFFGEKGWKFSKKAYNNTKDIQKNVQKQIGYQLIYPELNELYNLLYENSNKNIVKDNLSKLEIVDPVYTCIIKLLTYNNDNTCGSILSKNLIVKLNEFDDKFEDFKQTLLKDSEDKKLDDFDYSRNFIEIQSMVEMEIKKNYGKYEN